MSDPKDLESGDEPTGADAEAKASRLRGADLEGADQKIAGVNCTSPEYVADLLRHMRERTDKPLLAYPNSGEQYQAITKRWSGSPAATPFSEMARTWYQERALG